MSLAKFKQALITYLEGEEVKANVPAEFKALDDSMLLIFIRTYMVPRKNDLQACYIALTDMLSTKNYIIPPISDPAKAKILRFIQCFIEIGEAN